MGSMTRRIATMMSGVKFPTWKFNTDDLTIDELKSVRAGTITGIPFAGKIPIQGHLDGSGTPDVLSVSRGNQVFGDWYDRFDPNQGTIEGFWVPEKDRTAAQTNDEYFFYENANYYARYEHDNQQIVAMFGGQSHTDALTTAAGTVYYVAFSWDVKKTFDGTNYIRLTINDVHDFGATTQPTASAPDATTYIGSTGSSLPLNGLMSGFQFHRRVLFDGLYGQPWTYDGSGFVDELAAIYAAGAGADPNLLFGSWDTTLCICTKSVAETLDGVESGQAWSHPHSSNVLTDGFCQTAYAASAWVDVGSPVIPYSVEFDGSTTIINCGSDASIDDLQDNIVTWELYTRLDGAAENDNQVFMEKRASNFGWQFYYDVSATRITATINCATTNASSSKVTSSLVDGKIHHLVFFFNDAGDRKIYIAIDGVWVTSYDTQIEGVDAIVTDAGGDLILGNLAAGSRTMNGAIFWARLSDNDRHSHGTNFVPPSRLNPPANDANAVAQWDFRDGAGTTLTEENGNSNGTIANGTWNITPDMSVDAPGERIFPEGYVIGGDAVDEGTKETFAGLDAGENYVCRPVIGYERSWRCRPYILIYDETNGANISKFDLPWFTGTDDGAGNAAFLTDSTAPYWPYSLVGGTVYNITDGSSATITACGDTIAGTLAGGTDDDWDNGDAYMIVPPTGWAFLDPFTFELPTNARNGAAADCVSISLQVLDDADDGVMYVHQVELLVNLIDNPSLETGAGDPWIPDGWTNVDLDAGDTLAEATILHSGAGSMEWAVGASDEGIRVPTVAAIGDFIQVGMWSLGDGSAGFTIGGLDATKVVIHSDASTFKVSTPHTATWLYTSALFRVKATNPNIYILADSGAAGLRYTDDIHTKVVSGVDLTCTPSTDIDESGGKRIVGRTTATVTITSGKLKATKGQLDARWLPRHDAADAVKFGNSPGYIFDYYGDASNYIRGYWSAANTITLAVNAGGAGEQTANWDCTGAVVADTEYLRRIKYVSSKVEMYIDGVVKATVTTAINFTTALATDYEGSKQDGTLQSDMVAKSP